MLLFALKTLAFDRGKLLIALVGVVFSLVLVIIQMGLLLGLVRKGSLLVDHAKAHIWVGRRGVENVDFGYELPEVWLQRIRGLPEVRRAEPCIVGMATLTLPNGEYETVWVIGTEPDAIMGRAWNLSKGTARDLRKPDWITIDELDAWKMGNPQIGDVLEISGKRARVVAMTRGILPFTNTPFLFTNLQSAREYSRTRDGYGNYFLVEAFPDADHDDLCRRISRLVPDADVYKAGDFNRKSQTYWLARTGIGISFGAATALGIVVGMVMVGQSLYALTLDHLSDYATLKAIGAEDSPIYGILILQAFAISIVGTLLGVIAVYLIRYSVSTPVAPIEIPVWLLLGGITLNMIICLAASLLPFRRLRSVDPATVLQE